MGVKLNALRLASTTLIITKTKPSFNYGSNTQFLSFGLLSNSFLKETSSQYLVAPIVSLELRNKKIIKELTPCP